jgi:YVTN family beta-propeller protein
LRLPVLRLPRVVPLAAALALLVTVAAPAHAGPDPSSARTLAYVTNRADNTVSVIDTSSNAVTATIPVGSSPQAVAVNPAGTLAYVTNVNDDTVSLISTSRNTVTATIGVGLGPTAVAINPAGTLAYVANTGNGFAAGTVSVIDTSSNTVTATIPGRRQPPGGGRQPGRHPGLHH